MRLVLIFLIVMAFVACESGQWTQKEFKVWGNCEMCKETIEKSLKIAPVQAAIWNVETKMITVRYDEQRISLDSIQKRIAAVGYDSEKFRGSDKAYANLPDCCRYERKNH